MAKWFGPSPDGDCGCDCGTLGCPETPGGCKCYDGTAYIDKPDYEITISGVTNPSSPYITCAACSTFFNRTVTLSCGDTYRLPALSLQVICGPSSAVATCGLLSGATFGILGVIEINYTSTGITVSLTSIVGFSEFAGYNTTGGSNETFATELSFDDRTCDGGDQAGQMCATTREADVTGINAGLCSETDAMVCGVASASVSFTAV